MFIADLQNNRVLKETLSGPNYVESTVGTGLFNPAGVAVDAGGNVYIADTGNSRVLKETPSPLGWVQTVVGSGLFGPEGVAVGADGDLDVPAGGRLRGVAGQALEAAQVELVRVEADHIARRTRLQE